jgi:tRNA(Ser,Leu) C12 N-acetylase TAN1
MSSQDRKPKSYYVDYTKQRKSYSRGGRGGGGHPTNNARFREVPDFGVGGHKGFLITSVDEVKSYFEMRTILEGYYHDLYDEIDKKDDDKAAGSQTVEDELESELNHLRISRPFKQIRTHCRNSIFLNIVDKFNHVDPVLLVDKFFDEMAEKRTNRTSNTYKVLPVLDSFRNNVASAKDAITKLLSQKFLDESEQSKTYFIEFQSRGNYKLESEDKQRMIEGVADAVGKARPNWKVNRESADYMIVLIALRDICCLSVVQKYFERAKYNVMEFCKGFCQPDKEDPPRESDKGLVDEIG